MDVFFVRHGQTDGNIAKRYQHPETRLNEVGKAQAEAVAAEIAALKPTHIITSTQLRAVETARIITGKVPVIPETHPDFEELRRPLTLVGARYLGLTTLWYVIRWFFDWPHNQGETYPDFLARIKRGQAYLETLPADARVVVVSHSVFTNIFVEHLCLDRRLTLLEAVRGFWRILTLRNTAIIHLQYAKVGEGLCGWSVLKR